VRKTWTQIKNETMTKEEQRTAGLLALQDLAEMELADLREALQITQEDLANKLRVTQVAVSRLERRPNVLIETLSNYVEGLGGQLELRAILPNRTIRLTHLLATTERKKIARATKKNHREGVRAKPRSPRRAAARG
jgi:transcriptional regulator with XRE-family HTH domain